MNQSALLLRVAVFLVLSLKVTFVFAQPTNQLAETTPDRVQFRAILEALNPPSFPLTNFEARTVWSNNNVLRDRAAQKLRTIGTNALPLLLAELKAVGTIEATNATAAIGPKREVGAALKALGPICKPLLSELVQELMAGRNPENAADGLVAIGREGGPYLVQALTNSNSSVRTCGVINLWYFKAIRT
jgi:hypothetical protein